MTLLVIGGVVAVQLLRQLDAPGPLAAPATVVIEKGTGTRAIASQLEQGGVVSHDWQLLLALRLSGDGRPLQAGEYAFPANISPRAALLQMQEGETVRHRFTVVEGSTVGEIVGALQDEPMLAGDTGARPAEGSLQPDTYFFSRLDDRAALLRRMEKAQSAYLADAWEKRAEGLPLKTPEEALILASIVEKETGVASERPLVASVFVNRLRRGMRLQSDPTVIYALTSGDSRLERSLTRADLATASPYNTYMNAGLPPGPIANPGREAIDAVLHPAEGDYLYFVADGSGGHAFARTLAEHNDNVGAWRRLQRDKAAASSNSVAPEADQDK
ncbi:endolytic transglycosylase MltG [Radicibacter daui]|uniref:endolytic transglycosylase MltG n=1 Tax=Radicibacter daui TaxID=3064829 RepID=UPI0040470297